MLKYNGALHILFHDGDAILVKTSRGGGRCTLTMSTGLTQLPWPRN